MAASFFAVAPGLGVGEPLPAGWRSITDSPLLVIVGVTGVGKSTMLSRLASFGLRHTLLPDRRALTDALIITTMQRLDNAPVQPVIDRKLRFDYTRRYRELHPGGMAQALADLSIDPAWAGDNLLVFDGLRGENEIEWAAQLVREAHFIMLDAPDVVRVRRLLGRRDAFDQIGTTMGEGQGAGLAALGVADAGGLFTPAEERSLLALVETGEVDKADLRAKLQIVAEERRSYDPAATRAALLRCAGERALIIDTTRHGVDVVAQITARQVGAWGLIPGERKV